MVPIPGARDESASTTAHLRDGDAIPIAVRIAPPMRFARIDPKNRVSVSADQLAASKARVDIVVHPRALPRS